MERPLDSRVLAAGITATLGAAVAVWLWVSRPDSSSLAPSSSPDRTASIVSARPPASRESVQRFCGDCHAYPSPETFPRANWPDEVRRGFDFHHKYGGKREVPPVDDVIAYYQAHAPESFAILPRTPETKPPVLFRRREIPGPRPDEPSAVSFVGITSFTGSTRPDVLASEMVRGDLLICKPGADRAEVLVNGLAHPAHVEVVDLDGDGIKDLIVADLGIPVPSDERLGSVVWLRGRPGGSLETIPIASDLGRVCDVQAADFDGDGDLDLVVAVFGWRRVGEILLLEQRRGADGRPDFIAKMIDKRHGTIHVPVVDLNGDGRPDFVALISQEFESVVAFLNAGDGRFTPRTLYSASHPAFGSSGIQLVDMDKDGDVDVLMTNGDVYDSPLLKPYHGVQWLENRGEGSFVPHPIGPMYGAHRAVAGDIDGDGDLDIIASSFLGEPMYTELRREAGADALVLFEQIGGGRFARHAIERETCDYPSIALGDLDGDGDLDVVGGSFRDFRFSGQKAPKASGSGFSSMVIWENLGPRKAAP